MADGGDRSRNEAPAAASTSLYFFPEREVSEQELRTLLEQGTSAEKADAISHLLRYAVWDDIWGYVSREDVRDIFDQLDLQDSLRSAWARILKLQAPV